MIEAKLALAILLAVLGPTILLRCSGHAQEVRILKFGVVGITVLKCVLSVVVYAGFSHIDISSDAALYYLPETERLLAGELPYRDFATSYGPLFHATLAIPVLIWPSVGAIVLTMLAFETMTLFLYLRAFKNDMEILRWRTIFLYAWTPVSFYWIGLTGYNGAIIQFFAMLSLHFVGQNRTVLSSLALGAALMCSKFLAGILWPALVFVRRERWVQRSLVLGATLLPLLLLLKGGVNVLLPLEREFGAESSGNIWFVLSTVFPRLRGELLIHWIAGILVIVALFGAGVYEARRARHSARSVIDRGLATYSIAVLVFLLLSPKSYTFYHAMAFLFFCHVTLDSGELSIRTLTPISVLGVLSIIEPTLWVQIRDTDYRVSSPSVLLLLAVDVMMMAGYFWLIRESWRGYRTGSPESQATSAIVKA